MNKLDNPIWHALFGSHSHLAQGDSLARMYIPDFTTLAGMPELSPDALASLAKVLHGKARVGLFLLQEPSFPSDLNCLLRGSLVQMVCQSVIECKPQEMIELTKADVPEMKELAALTRPGPFADRAIEFGTFLGIRDGAKLVAMTGERMRIDDMREVSAVCTHPDYQGRGYARALVYEKARQILASGHLPFLHVLQENVAGIRSYEAVGFKQRRAFNFAVVAGTK
jgi:ribosomal protein S18 acetylase RimI-like enzyme